jgi:hypothetical protein
MSFWNVVWLICISFVFMAYLMMLFSIIGDLFRDRDLGGFAKAVWMLALIFVPFLSALVYLISRGGGMAERSVRSAHDARQRQDDYIREVAGSVTPADQVAQAKAMLDSGAITEVEYQSLKAKALV